MIAWGDAQCGGSLDHPITAGVTGGVSLATSLEDAEGIEEVVTTQCAFAVRTSKGNIVNWGAKAYGGNRDPASGVKIDEDACEPVDGVEVTDCTRAMSLPALGSKKATALAATQFAFAAVLDDKTVIAWGDTESGGLGPGAGETSKKSCHVPGEASPPNVLIDDAKCVAAPTQADIETLHSNNVAFAAITTSGQAVAWGSKENGGNIAPAAPDLTARIVKSIKPSGSAFTATVVNA
jgi:alpha-tubulin suppressor-like RCC1 family protein